MKSMKCIFLKYVFSYFLFYLFDPNKCSMLAITTTNCIKEIYCYYTVIHQLGDLDANLKVKE